ncbi:hypothetical protein EDB84DRAFT_798202 [Lactarius hengduanensis]|nr:hypothetical protein EDB84DRAFT_798202 [Lactarius hengduanensis]
MKRRRLICLITDVSSPSPTPVPENMLPPGPQLSLDSPVAGYDHASSSPEPHLPLVTATPDPWPPSVLDLGAAAEGEGSAGAELHKGRDALSPPSAIWENVVAAPDPPLQSPSPPSVPDVAIAGPSRCSLAPNIQKIALRTIRMASIISCKASFMIE